MSHLKIWLITFHNKQDVARYYENVPLQQLASHQGQPVQVEDGVAIELHFKKVLYEKDLKVLFKDFDVDWEVAHPRGPKSKKQLTIPDEAEDISQEGGDELIRNNNYQIYPKYVIENLKSVGVN